MRDAPRTRKAAYVHELLNAVSFEHGDEFFDAALRMADGQKVEALRLFFIGWAFVSVIAVLLHDNFLPAKVG